MMRRFIVVSMLVITTTASGFLQPVNADEPFDAATKQALLAEIKEDLLARQKALSNLTIKYDRVTHSDHFGEEHWTNDYFVLGDSVQSLIGSKKPLENGRIFRMYSVSKDSCFALAKYVDAKNFVMTGRGEAERTGMERHHNMTDLWLAQPGLWIPMHSVPEIFHKNPDQLALSIKDNRLNVNADLQPQLDASTSENVVLNFSQERPHLLESAVLSFEMPYENEVYVVVCSLTFSYDRSANKTVPQLVSAKWIEETFNNGTSGQKQTIECRARESRLNNVDAARFHSSYFGFNLPDKLTTSGAEPVAVATKIDPAGKILFMINNKTDSPLTLQGSNQLACCFKWGCLGELKEQLVIPANSAKSFEITYYQDQEDEFEFKIDLFFLNAPSIEVPLILPRTLTASK